MASDENESEVTCPACMHQFQVVAAAHIPDSQVLVMTMESETNMFAARTVGGIITETTKLLETIAEDDGSKVVVFIQSIEYTGPKVEIHFIIAQAKDDEPSNAK